MKLKPMADNILLKQTEAEETTSSGIILATTTKEKPAIYEVMSAGPDVKDIKAGVIACDGVMPSFGGFRRGAMPMADPKPMTASFDYFRIISK